MNILEALFRIEELEHKNNRLQELLDKARGPEGQTEENVAKWLRSRGYTVTKQGEENATLQVPQGSRGD